MARTLTRCSRCGVHVFSTERGCPFCGSRRSWTKAAAGLAGAVAFVSGIGCAYGCPEATCGAALDAGGDATSATDAATDARVVSDAGVSGDAKADGG